MTVRAGPSLIGRLRHDPRATEFGDHVFAILSRYVREVVLEHRLCRFATNESRSLGSVIVVLEFDVDPVALGAELARPSSGGTGEDVMHVVFPLVDMDTATFERFGGKLASEHSRHAKERLVHANFHPAMTGGTENAHRMVGFVRRAPDAFVQFVPPGLASGGTVLSSDPSAALGIAGGDVGEHTFQRLRGVGFERVDEAVRKLRDVRTTLYAPYVEHFRAQSHAHA